MEYISIREAADRMGVGHKVIRRLVAQGAVSASKFHGAHGVEWRVERASLDAYAEQRKAPRPAAVPAERVRVPAPPAPGDGAAPAAQAELEALRADKRFLTRQLEAMTALLSNALSNPGDAPQAVPSPSAEPDGASAPTVAHITSALQTSLQSLGPESVRSFELCSVKVLWGKPVLWRVAVEEAEDVARLLDAILSPSAVWAAPGEEVVFVWAFDASGSVLWGAACGPGWFGAEFETALSGCRVTRR